MHFPTDGERHAIVGMTGSGKTVFGLWCLARRSFDRMPWVIMDFKRDTTIAQIPRLEEVDIRSKPPKHRGLYVVRPSPGETDDGLVTQWLYGVWERERTGLFLDEGYSIPRMDRALRAVLTQGRSKRIPMIALSQRPSWISPFILSESEYKSIFFLQTPADIDRIQEWIPETDDTGRRLDPSSLPLHHSYWYCMPKREFARFGPCPDEAHIMNLFDARTVRKHWF